MFSVGHLCPLSAQHAAALELALGGQSLTLTLGEDE